MNKSGSQAWSLYFKSSSKKWKALDAIIISYLLLDEELVEEGKLQNESHFSQEDC